MTDDAPNQLSRRRLLQVGALVGGGYFFCPRGLRGTDDYFASGAFV